MEGWISSFELFMGEGKDPSVTGDRIMESKPEVQFPFILMCFNGRSPCLHRDSTK